MSMRSKKGQISLIISVLGLIIVQTLIYFKYIGGYWHIVLAGFEAATIGGFADWFAVKALFCEIPIPFVKKHTNIIVKNREKISKSIVDLVTNEWLSPEVIKDKIIGISISNKIFNYLKTSNKEKIKDFLNPIINEFKKSFNINEVIKNQIERINVNIVLGRFIKGNIGNESYNQFFETILNGGQSIINKDETKEFLKSTLQNQVSSYKKESGIKGFLLSLGEESNIIDYNSIVEKLIISFNELIEEAKVNPNSNLRVKIDDFVLKYSEGLINNENNKLTESIKQSLLNVKWDELLNRNSTDLENIIFDKLQELIIKSSENKELKLKIDEFIFESIEKIISDNHNIIGNMVEESLNKLNDKDLVNQIEDKVGDDLQYIRLNGAIVGGLVGVIIASIRTVLL